MGTYLALKQPPLHPKFSRPLAHVLAAISWQTPQGHTSVQTPFTACSARGTLMRSRKRTRGSHQCTAPASTSPPRRIAPSPKTSSRYPLPPRSPLASPGPAPASFRLLGHRCQVLTGFSSLTLASQLALAGLAEPVATRLVVAQALQADVCTGTRVQPNWMCFCGRSGGHMERNPHAGDSHAHAAGCNSKGPSITGTKVTQKATVRAQLASTGLGDYSQSHGRTVLP